MKLNILFNMSKWKSFKCGKITRNKMTEEFKRERQHLNNYLHEYIFDKYKHNTIAKHMYRTTTGYSLFRSCQKSSSRGCKSFWHFKIDINHKSIHLTRKLMCNHIANVTIVKS